MKFANVTKDGTKVLAIQEVAMWKFKGFLVLLEGFHKPFIYNDEGVCEEANEARCDDACDLMEDA